MWLQLLAQSQVTPRAHAAHYTYSRDDKVPAGNGFTLMDQLADGSVVMRLYGKDFIRVTNTGARPIYFGSTLADFPITEIAGLGTGNAIFFAYPNGLVRLEGDSLQAYARFDSVNGVVQLPSGNFLLLQKQDKKTLLCKYDGTRCHPVPLPAPAKEFEVGNFLFISNLPDGSFRLAAKQASMPLYVWQYHEKTNTWTLDGLYEKSAALQQGRNFGKDSLMIFTGNLATMHYPVHTQKKPRAVDNRHSQLGARDVDAIEKQNYAVLQDYKPGGLGSFSAALHEGISYVQRDRFYNSMYLGLQTHPHRVFPHVKHFTSMYASGNSSATLTMAQAPDGTLFFGGYEGYATSLHKGKFTYIDVNRAHVLSGGTIIDNKLYAFAELAPGLIQLQKDKMAGYAPAQNEHGYYLTYSRDSNFIYGGFGMHKGIGIIARADLVAGRDNWKRIDAARGLRMLNVLTIAEDPRGRIWFGRISQGWGVYYPGHDTAITYLRQEGTTTFGAMATYCDRQGTMWLGGSDGLWLADANKKDTITPKDVVRLQHPLLPAGIQVVSITPWGRYLVFTAAQKLLLLDLDQFYRHKKAILSGEKLASILYVNPQELPVNPQAQWNQNCLLTDRKDSTLWVAANDDIYNIDLKKWLTLQRPYAAPRLQVIGGLDTFMLHANHPAIVPPTSNSLIFKVQYQTTDNMPRLLQVALYNDGDSIRWSSPDKEIHFEAWNKQTGNYTFAVRVFEHDGTINEFRFPIVIRAFLWQQWWFWALLSAVVVGVAFGGYYLHKQKELAEANAARLAAEAEALKAEQQRKLTAMQVKSLSTQFRPHFILNALNTIGAQLYDKPEVDEVLGQLGESIGIIFKNAQAGAIAHPLATEWRLVQSVINIKQMEMRHAVKVHWKVHDNVLHHQSHLVPMGILQIPIENALVHGLRNKEDGERNLWINALIEKASGTLYVAITDNGIGRKAAAQLSNYRSNGVGSRNLQAIVDLLNPLNELPITIAIEDLPLVENGKPCGTRVTVSIPENYKYEY